MNSSDNGGCTNFTKINQQINYYIYYKFKVITIDIIEILGVLQWKHYNLYNNSKRFHGIMNYNILVLSGQFENSEVESYMMYRFKDAVFNDDEFLFFI